MDEQQRGTFLRVVNERLSALDRAGARSCIGCGKCKTNCPYVRIDQTTVSTPLRRGDVIRTCLNESGIIARGLQRLGRRPRIDSAFINTANALAWHCTMCGTCRLHCPRDVPSHQYTAALRTASVAAGVMPPFAQEIRDNAVRMSHTFGLSWEQAVGGIVRQSHEQGFGIPVDQPGAEYFLVCSAIANARHPQGILRAAELFYIAGIRITMSGSLADTGTEIHTTAIDAALSEQYVQRIIAEMKRLNCRTLIVGECGCDARTFLVDKANQFRRAGLSVAYLDDVLVDALERGKLVARHRLPVTATLHDPCWLVRKGGYRWSSRRILERCVASDRFVELTPNLEHNLCCRGGAGMLRAYPTTDAGSNRRREQSLPKAAQLRHSGAQVVVSPCTTCVLSLGDIVRYHGVKSSGGKPMEVRLLIEMLHAAVTGRVEAEA